MSDDAASSAPSEPFEIIVGDDETRQRLDRVLVQHDLGVSRAVLQRWIEEGRVEVDGDVATRRMRPRAGQRVRIAPAPPPASDAEPQDIPLHVLYEDTHLLVIDKPAGLVVHPAPGHPDGTLVNALLFHGGIRPGERGPRPGIVHRLDKDTSGVMVVARSDDAREGLIAQFKDHAIERRYQALVTGTPPDEVTYDTWYGRHPTSRKRFTSRVREGRRAITHVRVRERLHGAALVDCRLETGRTHQIRVHLAEHGAPVLGDPMYGRAPAAPSVREVARELGRQALHAGVLELRHPITHQWHRFETVPPDDFQRACAQLRDGM